MIAIGVLRRAPRVGRASLYIGGFVSAVLVLTSILSLYWTPQSAHKMHMADRLSGPTSHYLLGTDQFGRDVLSMLMVGSQTALTIGIVAVLIGLLVGVALGLLAAAVGGWVEEVCMRASDLMFAFPVVLLAIMFAAAFGPGSMTSMIAIGLQNVPVFARLTRGAAKSIWTREYVTAAKVGGRGTAYISLTHVLPNVLNILVVQATISFAIAILTDAALSYLGLGTQPPTPTWGRMLRDAQTYMDQNPFLAIFPGLTIAVTVLGLNQLGDALRDLLDPRYARSR